MTDKGLVEEAITLLEASLDEEAAGEKYDPPKGPKELGPLYSKCRDWLKTSKKHKGMDEQRQKEYCSRNAWRVFCDHINPDYEGCSKNK